MRIVVTGAAGFIGSHLCEELLERGHEVVGIDSFVDYYPRPIKEVNLRGLRDRPGFMFCELDLRSDPLDGAARGCGRGRQRGGHGRADAEAGATSKRTSAATSSACSG